MTKECIICEKKKEGCKKFEYSENKYICSGCVSEAKKIYRSTKENELKEKV